MPQERGSTGEAEHTRGAPYPAETVGGRRARFEQNAAPHLDTLFRVALRMTGAVDRAEDVVQEAYLRAWKYFDSFDRTRDAKVWLLAILRNSVFEESRKRRRRVNAVSLDQIGAAGEPPSQSSGPRDCLEAAEALNALARLPEGMRTVALLAIVDRMKYREIAEVLAIPIGTVMSRLARARQFLRRELEESGRPSCCAA